VSKQLANGVKITKLLAGAVTGTTTLTAILDMQGYEGVLIFGTIATAATGNYIKAGQGALAAGTDAADLAGSKVVATANAETCWLDIYKPQDRYITASIVRGTTTVTGDLFALQYENRVGLAGNLTTDTIVGALLVSPSEGTA
jgi:hypothetical protein